MRQLPWCVLEHAGGGATFETEAQRADELAIVALNGERFGSVGQLLSADLD
jgi:hypothetical protein